MQEKITELGCVESWRGKARLIKELEKLQTIDIGIEKSELKRIIRATYIDGFPPKLKLQGYEFHLSLDELEHFVFTVKSLERLGVSRD